MVISGLIGAIKSVVVKLNITDDKLKILRALIGDKKPNVANFSQVGSWSVWVVLTAITFNKIFSNKMQGLPLVYCGGEVRFITFGLIQYEAQVCNLN